MPTKSQSPGPNPATTSLESRARNQGKETSNRSGRAGSAGGVVLEKEQKETNARGKTDSTPAKLATVDAAKAKYVSNTNTTDSTGPNRQRRRPRKLNKQPTAQQTETVSATTASRGVNETTQSAPPTELEALKSRVRGLEAKVEELYKSGAGDRGASGARSPRRRGKGRKGSNAQPPATSTTDSPKVEEIDEEADDELVRLEGELEVARQHLDSYQPRPRTKRSTSGTSEYIEEIPRDTPGVEDTVTTGSRKVTLTGSYRIPLPATVSMEDVKSIQSGVTAAQNVAKSFLEQRRSQQSVQRENQKPSQASSSSAVMTNQMEGEGNQSWGEWFGGYSMAISRAVKSIEAEAAVESQRDGNSKPKRPPQTGKGPAGSSKKNAAKPAARSSAGT